MSKAFEKTADFPADARCQVCAHKTKDPGCLRTGGQFPQAVHIVAGVAVVAG